MTRWQHLDDKTFDRWVERSLRQRYAPALREPLPENLLDLLPPEQSGK